MTHDTHKKQQPQNLLLLSCYTLAIAKQSPSLFTLPVWVAESGGSHRDKKQSPVGTQTFDTKIYHRRHKTEHQKLPTHPEATQLVMTTANGAKS